MANFCTDACKRVDVLSKIGIHASEGQMLDRVSLVLGCCCFLGKCAH